LSFFRIATFTLEKPSPTGVVQGPLSATPHSRTASIVSRGSVSFEPRSTAASPA